MASTPFFPKSIFPFITDSFEFSLTAILILQTSFKGIIFCVGEYKSSTVSANSNFDIATFASTDKLTSIILLSPKSF